jgi:hypothetical protein
VRATNRLFALLVGLALAGAGGFIALETILAAAGQPFVVIPGRRWLGVLRHTKWSAATVIVVLAVVAAVGLVLLAAEARRWPRWRAPIAAVGGTTTWWVTRRSVEAHLARQLRASTEALRPRPRLIPRDHRWQIRVRAGMPAPADEDARAAMAGQIEEIAGQVMARLGAPESSRVKVRLRRARRARRARRGRGPGPEQAAR